MTKSVDERRKFRSRPGLFTRSWKYLWRFKIYDNFVQAQGQSSRVYWKELQTDQKFFEELELAVSKFPKAHAASLGAALGHPSKLEGLAERGPFSIGLCELYVLVRRLRPRIIVETGVAAGVSTSIILRALDRNSGGTLHSIDLPNRAEGGYRNRDGRWDPVFTPARFEPGWIVPPSLRSRWFLHLGDSRSVLRPVLERLERIDLFYHDSDHSYENMTFELHAAWPHLRTGGVVYADDVFWNTAFDDFCVQVSANSSAIVTPAGRAASLKLLIDGGDLMTRGPRS